MSVWCLACLLCRWDCGMCHSEVEISLTHDVAQAVTYGHVRKNVGWWSDLKVCQIGCWRLWILERWWLSIWKRLLRIVFSLSAFVPSVKAHNSCDKSCDTLENVVLTSGIPPDNDPGSHDAEVLTLMIVFSSGSHFNIRHSRNARFQECLPRMCKLLYSRTVTRFFWICLTES